MSDSDSDTAGRLDAATARRRVKELEETCATYRRQLDGATVRERQAVRDATDHRAVMLRVLRRATAMVQEDEARARAELAEWEDDARCGLEVRQSGRGSRRRQRRAEPRTGHTNGKRQLSRRVTRDAA
jgi:hypothetical protein